MSKEKKCVKISIIGAESVVLTTDYVLIMNGLTTDLVSEVELYNNVGTFIIIIEQTLYTFGKCIQHLSLY
ncbi:hypothetical protein KQI42_08790 [Tissierella sp. MSJ-40]|uniref:Uncharacterized protein n=1 Tax=Tissierella simiarum TaxID=2841534 RepID=A0ABS6E5P8_9FIRM|nr:hypothetical protein [Tissierella simiarum]MBU5438102.1 hypothetical protein [Tissierella simiarum]